MNQAPDLTLQEAEPLHYDKRTVLFSWLSLAVGYLYCRTFFITNRPFYGFLFTLLLFAFGALANRSPKPIKKDTLRALFYPASALLLNCSLFISGAPVVQFFVFTYSLLAFLLFCHFKSNNRMESLAVSLYFGFELLLLLCKGILKLCRRCAVP